jgi:hypothetical protein
MKGKIFVLDLLKNDHIIEEKKKNLNSKKIMKIRVL